MPRALYQIDLSGDEQFPWALMETRGTVIKRVQKYRNQLDALEDLHNMHTLNFIGDVAGLDRNLTNEG